MVRKALLAALTAVCLAIPVVAQSVGDYLDVYIVKVKPEKAADFEALARKVADANRKNHGDQWLAMESQYGENNVYMFVSSRQSYADLDKAQDSFMGAMNKTYGKDMSQKMLNEWNNYIAGARSEFRKRRWDLSRKAPTDPAAYTKFIGTSRVLRTTAVHVKPGKIAEFEALLKDLKEAAEKAETTQPVLVSQVIEGGKGTVFYISGLRPGLDGFDKNPSARDILGEEGYKKYLRDVSETVDGTDSMIYRYSAELSSPPEQVIAVAPDFWNPKPVVAAKPKPKSPAEPAAQKEKQ
jgi:quinol monooxygenase YgiN